MEVPLVWSSEVYWWHYLKFVWDAFKARDLMRSWPTNTTEDCNRTEHTAVEHSCQSDPRHGTINQQVLERTWKQRSCEGQVNTASLLSSESVGLSPEGQWKRAEVCASSSHRQLHSCPSCLRQTHWRKVEISVCVCVRVWLFFHFETIPATASPCFCFLNLKSSVPSLHIHVYFNTRRLP